MKVRTYIAINTDLYLEGPQEEFIAHTRDRHWPFYVSHIRWHGGDHCTLRGPAQKRDGTRSFISREQSVRFDSLSQELQDRMTIDRAEEIMGLRS